MTSPSTSSRTWYFAASFILLAGTLAGSHFVDQRKPQDLVQPLTTIDRTIEGFTGTDNPPLSDRVLARLLPTSYLLRNYKKNDLNVDMFIAFYAMQRAGEGMHSPKHCLPGGGWEIWQHGAMTVPVNGRAVEINKYSIERSGTRNLMMYWYQSKDRIIASEYLGKILLVKDTLLTGNTSGSIVRITLPDTAGAEEVGRKFAVQLIPQVQRCFGN